MRFLVSAAWIEEEAERRGMRASAEEVGQNLAAGRARFPDARSYQRWRVSSGLSDDDLRFQARLGALAGKLRKEVAQSQVEVTDAQVDAYYAANRARLIEPERRQITVATKRSRAEALRLRARTRGDPAMRGATELTFVEGSDSLVNRRQPALAAATFRARRGALVGPIRTGSEYRVFRVTQIVAARTRPLAEVREAIRAQLAAERERRAVDRFLERLRARYRPETQCAPGFVVPDCQNAPKS